MHEDLQRHLIELSYTSGKKYIHPEMGFITSQEPGFEGCVLLYDNFLYALALLRTKTHENILDARKLLDRLFCFQSDGSFPVFLHDFPKCADRMQAVHILTVLYWVQKEFGHVLVNPKLAEVIQGLIASCKQNNNPDFPLWAKIKQAAVLHAFSEKGTFAQLDDAFLPDPVSLSQLMLAYQLAPDAIDWSPLWQMVGRCWHAPSKRFAGPSFRLFQDGFEQQVTLFDYFMGLFTGALAPCADKIQPAALSASLVRFPHAAFTVPEEYTSEKPRYSIFHMPHAVVSCIADREPNHYVPGFSPFYFLSENHSLTLDITKGVVSDYTHNQLTIDLDKEVFLQERENAVVSFCFDNQPDCSVRISNQISTCFELHEPILITLGKVSLRLTFERLTGDGEFVGHSSRANRKSQKQTKDRTAAYDVRLFLRAIRGSMPCQLRVKWCIINA